MNIRLPAGAALALGIALIALRPAPAAADDDFLPVEQAFEYAVAPEKGALVVSYNIRDGYYLYRERIGFATDTPGVALGAANYPKGLPHHDDYFGEQEIYRGAAAFRVPYTLVAGAPGAIDLKLKLQGCADKGLCYPPQTWTTRVVLKDAARLAAAAPAPAPAAVAAAASAGATRLLDKLVAKSEAADDDFLPVDEAFRYSATADGASVRLHWVIADGYYLYRGRIKVSGESALAELGAPQFPTGLPHRDDYFGEQEIYRNELVIPVPYARSGPAAGSLAVKVVYQGCADKGLCYPPQTRVLALALPRGEAGGGGAPVSEQDRYARLIREGNLLLVIGSFVAFGLGLALTPCVLPMVPIVSGIIAGEGANTSRTRGFVLSLAYVLGMVLTYTVVGVACAAAGRQAQAFFQQTWILVLFAALFVALALAMFGLYQLQLPSALQTRVADASNRLHGGKLVSVAVMGALSSLVVTACIAPPVAAAAAVVGQVGDLVRGGVAFASLSFGMGIPLLVVGASAGTLLPKAGPWMETVKALFGVVFLGVAALMLDRVLPARVEMLAWAAVALVAVWVLLGVGLRGGRRTPMRWALGALGAGYGALLIASAVAGGTDPLRPLSGTGLLGASARAEALPFRAVRTVADLDRELGAATAGGKRTMLDFSADWCVSCKEMEKHTFSDPRVREMLASYVLLKADVTGNTDDDQALLKRFRIIGPPTTAFFARDGRERQDYRLVGYVAPDKFREHVGRFESSP